MTTYTSFLALTRRPASQLFWSIGTLFLVLSFYHLIPELSSATTETWVRQYNGPANGLDVPYGAQFDSKGDLIVIGTSKLSDNTTEFYTVKYRSADGVVIWERRFHGVDDLGAYVSNVAIDKNGDIFVTGNTTSSRPSAFGHDTDFYLVKYAGGDGAIIWEKTWSVSDLFDTDPRIVLDGKNNVILAANLWLQAGRFTFQYDFYVAKIGGSSGDVVWELQYDGLAKKDDRVHAVCTDADGNAIIAAESGTADGYESYLAKYSAADGRLLWEKHLPVGGDLSLATDGFGNVLISADTNSREPDLYTAKFAGADGTLLWERTFDNGGLDEHTYRFGIDSFGNVAVAGITGRYGSSNYDILVVKYSPDGSVAWTHRYDGPNHGTEYPYGVAFDHKGNVILAGFSETFPFGSAGSAGSDIYVARYAAADGAVLWERRYDSPKHADDSSPTLALAQDDAIAVVGSTQTDPASGDSYDILALYYGAETEQPRLEYSASAGTLKLSWPARQLGWHLEYRTISKDSGTISNWLPVPNSSETNSITVSLENRAAFFRLASP
jgi:hypothetical protein